LAQNPNTQVNPSSALFTAISCSAGSNGTYITGIQVGYLNLATGVNNIVLKRNLINGTGSATSQLYLLGNNANVLIIQNYIVGNQNGNYAPIWLVAGCSNVTIANNFIQGTSSSGYVLLEVDAGASAVVTNNVLWGTAANQYITLNNSTFNNNILNVNGPINGVNNSENNNFSMNANLDTTGGNAHHNHINIPEATIFVNTGSYDGSLKLKAGSPAIGAGYSGEDCGMFGGSDPYVLSGMPTVPAIYSFSAPTSGSGTLPVQVKIMSHK